MASEDNIYVTKNRNGFLMQFPSAIENINRAEEETRQFLQHAGLSEEFFPVCLVMREALLNAIKHGNRHDPDKTVTYSLRLDDEILTLEIEDEGEGFDWQSMDHTVPNADLEHGRGLFIMKRYFSDFTFNQKGNKLTLTKYSSAPPPEEESEKKRLEELAQSILMKPESVAGIPSSDIFHLIENLYIRLNRMSLENAELRRAQSWLMSFRQKQRKAADEDDRYRALFEHNPIETITVDHEGRVTEYNLAKKKAGDRLPTIGSVMYKDYAASHEIDMYSELMNCIETGQPKEFKELPYRHKYLHIRIAPFSGGAIVTSVNITPLKEAERNLTRLATAIEQAREEIVVFDIEGKIEYVNAAFSNNNALTQPEAVGRDFFQSAQSAENRIHNEAIWNALSEGRTWQGRFSRNKPGDTDRLEMESTISPVKDKNGQIICYVAVMRDVTRESRLKEQLRHAHKMQSIGTLAGGIAHDFNNILGFVTNNAELIAAEAPADSIQESSANQILLASRRAKVLVNQILSFSRDSGDERKPLRIAVIVKETLRMLRAILPSTIRISQRISDETATVMGDPTQIQEVLMNLCNNAAQAMRENGGELKISLEAAAEEELSDLKDLPSGDYVKLAVYDTGHGIHSEVIDRIFDPFFTLKHPEEGAGLGLSVAQGIMADHGGTITAASEYGKWTKITAFFPKTETTEEEPAEPAADPLPRGHASILLVDDESLMTEVGEKMLSRLGYRVTIANSGQQALELFMEAPDNYDLVITDMTMPYMTGVDLAKTLMEIRPGVPIILCTGYNAMVTPEKARTLGIKKFIMKPFEMKKMSKAIREVLEDEDRQELR